MDVSLALGWMQNTAAAMSRHQDYLTQLDSAIGDGDHGANMARGFGAVRDRLDDASRRPDSVSEILVMAGSSLLSVVGGASGPLFGSAFRAVGEAVGTASHIDVPHFAEALAAGLKKAQQLGAAVPGDKTMIDAYAPAVSAFGDAATAGADFRTAAHAAADAAEAGMRATVPLQAKERPGGVSGVAQHRPQGPGRDIDRLCLPRSRRRDRDPVTHAASATPRLGVISRTGPERSGPERP